MDVVYIKDLQIETVIGIFDWERKIKQTVSLDLDLSNDNRVAAEHDSIDSTLDYKSVAKRIIGFVEESRFQLVETLAEEIAKIVLEEFNVTWLRLRLGKQGALRGAVDVGVVIERGKRS